MLRFINTMCAFATFAAVLISAPALADGDNAQDKVQTGFNAYLKDGIEAALKEWLKDGPYDNDTKLISTTVNDFTLAEQTMGKPENFEIVRETPVSPRTRAIFAILYYPKGEEFFLFQMYRSKDGEWLVTNMESNNHIFEILPKDVVFTRP